MNGVRRWMDRRYRAVVMAATGLLVMAGGSGAAPPQDATALATRARQAGLRVLAGDHVVLLTDRPPREGDGVADLPRVFDAAFGTWCAHYGIEPASLADWRACGCLVVDRDRFRTAGLLPDTDFGHGFCDGTRFWLADPSNPAYRRHLFLHEGVHAFTISVRGLDAPQWYREGIAEYLATHRLVADAAGGSRFVATPMPAAPDDVEQLGRIESLRALVAAGHGPTLDRVFAAPVTAHDEIAAYAANWAAVALFTLHPAHARGFANLERGPLDARLNQRLAALPGWQPARAARDYAAFVSEIDYGWDFDRLAIDWAAGRPPAETETFTVAAGRGWQNTHLALPRGSRWSVVATGRAAAGDVRIPPGNRTTPIESTPEGISLRWYRGHPVGRLLAAQWVEPETGGPGRFAIIGASSPAVCTASADGPLYLKINEAPGRLAAWSGGFDVRITAAPP